MAVTDEMALEQRVLRESCGLIDRSERGKLALTGTDAQEFLTGQVSNDILALEPGQGCYAALLSPKGKMLADLRVIRTAPPPDGEPWLETERADELWLDTERVALQALFDNLRGHMVGYDVQLHKRTLEQGLVSLVGPDARAAVGRAPADVEHASRHATLGGAPVVLISTDLGVDVLCDAAQLTAVTAALLDTGAVCVSEGAAECMRVLSGRPRYGIDLDDSTIPQEGGINERAVSFTKGCYVGQETVARLYYRGRPNRQLRGLILSGQALTGEQLRLGERLVGRLGSFAISPELGPIGLALVRREAGPGERLDVGESGVRARVVELPFAWRDA